MKAVICSSIGHAHGYSSASILLPDLLVDTIAQSYCLSDYMTRSKVILRPAFNVVIVNLQQAPTNDVAKDVIMWLILELKNQPQYLSIYAGD